MTVIVDCPNCGPQHARGIIGGSGSVTIGGGSIECPICGRRAAIRGGTYTIIDNVLRAFEEGKSTRADISRFRDIVAAVESGEVKKDVADRQIEELGGSFAKVWQWTNENSGVLTVLLSIIAIYLAVTASEDSERISEKLQASVERQTQVVQMIEAELRKQNVPVPNSGALQPPTVGLQTPGPLQKRATATRPNRHERRKAASKAKRQPRL